MNSEERNMMRELIIEINRIATALESLNQDMMIGQMQEMYLDELVGDEKPQ